jgi:hypothetical protein
MQFVMKKLLPIGSYRGPLKAVERTEHPEYGAGVCFKFVVEHGAESGQEVGVTCNSEKPPTKKNKLGRILGGLAGHVLQPGEAIDATRYVGKKFIFMVGHSEDGANAVVTSVVPDTEAPF